MTDLLAVGLLRPARHLDLAEIGADRLAAEHAADGLARRRAGRDMADGGDDLDRRKAGADVRREQLEIRAFVQRHVQLDAAVTRRGVEREHARSRALPSAFRTRRTSNVIAARKPDFLQLSLRSNFDPSAARQLLHTDGCSASMSA